MARAAAAALSLAMTSGISVWIVPWDEAGSGAALDCFDEIHPFALALSSAPALYTASPGLLEAAKRRRGKAAVVPVVVNDVFAEGKLRMLKSDFALSILLSDPRSREAHVRDLAEAAEGWDGIEIDYERVPAELWVDYSDFVERLASALHSRGKTLSVVLEPGVVRSESLARKVVPRLARSADTIVLMAYYERTGLSLHPGPGASLPWVVDVSRRALRWIPYEKLSVALSLAGTDWAAYLPAPATVWKESRRNYGQVMRLLSERGADVLWDPASSCPYFRAKIEGRPHEVWFENEKSLAEKVRALRGLGIRRLGFWYWGRIHPDTAAIATCRT